MNAKQSITIQAPKLKVWEALTEPQKIKQYFFGTNTNTDWVPGHPIEFSGEWEGKQYKDKGEVIEFIPGEKLVYTHWSPLSGLPDLPENYYEVTYELSGDETSAELTITQSNITDEKARDHSMQNWKTVMENLKKMVESNVISYQ